MNLTVEKRVHLTQEKADRLGKLAAEKGITEGALLEKALDILFAVTEGSWPDDRSFWSTLSSDSLDRVWDNPEDARYDNWKELYGVR
jgi:hypothetical protein